MRSSLDLSAALKGTLERALARILSDLTPLASPKDLRRSRDMVEKQFGAGLSSLATVDRLEQILKKIRSGEMIRLTQKERFILAHTISQASPLLNDKSVLDTDGAWQPPLLAWETEIESNGLRASHWRGLFHSFLQAAPGPGMSRLRDLLLNAWPSVTRRAKARMSWIADIRRHQGLLGTDPCRPYVEELVRGASLLLDDLRRTASVPPASWFWRELTASMARFIGTASDDALKSNLPTILKCAADLPGARDAILVSVLDRYESCTAKDPAPSLLSFALDAWGTPQLARNALWGQVKPAAKRMVCGWLALEDLEDFYRLCQGAGQVDERRLRYWLRFKEQITFSQIVLGSEMLLSRAKDVREFRERKKGRYASLTRSGSRNNAIIMQIGNWTFVEFSETGNACYPYRSDQLPVQIGRSVYSLHELKTESVVLSAGGERLKHQSDWESDTFDPFLRRRGIHPDADSRRVDRLVDRASGPPRAAKADSLPPAPLDHALFSEIHECGGNIVDNRPRGGALWILGDSFNPSILRALKSLGFKAKPGQGLYLS